jgi:hypothetical protein
MTDDSGLLIRRGGQDGFWTAPGSTDYDDEAHLQQILAASPGQVPGVSDQARAVRELQTSAGPLDVCIVDVDGRLTVVECKLASNSERRRMVIGQVIDYAAAIWRDGEAAFHSAWQLRSGADLHEVLSADALAQLSHSIVTGQLNLCLAVDRIDGDLRRLIEFLNLVAIPQVSVTAIQLSYARDGDVEILMPTTFGGELAEARVAPAARGERWTKDAFLNALVDDEDRAKAAWLLARVEATHPDHGPHARVWFGARPGGSLFLNPFGREYSPIQLWVNKAGQLLCYGNWSQFSAVKHHEGFRALAVLLGQDHHGGQRGVPVSTLDCEQLWATVCSCSEIIHMDGGAPQGVGI